MTYTDTSMDALSRGGDELPTPSSPPFSSVARSASSTP